MKKILAVLLLISSLDAFAIGGNSNEVKNERGLSGYGIALVREEMGTEDSDEFFCSGVLLNSEHILTAAHCMDDMDQHNYYAIRTNNYRHMKHQIHPREDEFARELDTASTVIPEGYSSEGIYNDYAIVRLKTPFEDVTAISILPQGEDLNEFDSFYISGFSKSALHKRDYGVFRYVSVTYDDEKTGILEEGHLYLKPDGNMARAYGADSGGGIFVKKNGAFYLIGSLIRSDISETGDVFAADLRYLEEILPD